MTNFFTFSLLFFWCLLHELHDWLPISLVFVWISCFLAHLFSPHPLSFHLECLLVLNVKKRYAQLARRRRCVALRIPCCLSIIFQSWTLQELGHILFGTKNSGTFLVTLRHNFLQVICLQVWIAFILYFMFTHAACIQSLLVLMQTCMRWGMDTRSQVLKKLGKSKINSSICIHFTIPPTSNSHYEIYLVQLTSLYLLLINELSVKISKEMERLNVD